MKIKEIPLTERPRERLLATGTEKLTNEELLAILLKTGTYGYSAKNIASFILKEVGTIQNLKTIKLNQLLQIKGIGKVKACEIMAFIELSKRMNQEISSLNNIKINSSNLVFQYYKDLFKNQTQEQFHCIYLDSSKKVLETKLLFIGTINKSNVYPREIFKEAYLLGATSIICIHNHPSNNINPSKEDKLITDSLKEVGYLMDVKLLDHLIIGKDKYYSFLENGEL